MSADAAPLQGQICIVAGASRGVGRGIALGLGEAGATVIATGRSSRFGERTDRRHGETVEDTAADIEALGGRGFPYVCDHTDRAALHDMAVHVRKRHGAPDVLVFAVWGGNETYDGDVYADGARFGTPFDQRPLQGLVRALESSVYAAFATLGAVAPLMKAKGGLIVLVGFDGEGAYLGDPFYDMGMATLLRSMTIMAHELQDSPISVCHLSPGFVATERVRDADLGAQTTETPLYAGRAVAALAADPDRARHHGRSLFVADLARDYGFTDEDGSQPSRFVLESEKDPST